MPEHSPSAGNSPVVCTKCQRDLVLGNVTVSYLGQVFPVKLLKCPECAAVFVPEELATGKMLQVEQALEDK